MAKNKPVSKKFSSKEMDLLIEEGLKRTAIKLIEKEKKNNGYFIFSDKDGNPIKVPAKDL
jgi:hypothetical protein